MTDFYQSDPDLVLFYQDQITVSTILTWIRPAICRPPAIHQPVRQPGCRHNCSDLSFSWPRVRSSVFQLGWPCCQLRHFFGPSLVIRQKTKSINSIHISNPRPNSVYLVIQEILRFPAMAPASCPGIADWEANSAPVAGKVSSIVFVCAIFQIFTLASAGTATIAVTSTVTPNIFFFI